MDIITQLLSDILSAPIAIWNTMQRYTDSMSESALLWGIFWMIIFILLVLVSKRRKVKRSKPPESRDRDREAALKVAAINELSRRE